MFRPFAKLLERDYKEDAAGRSSFALGLILIVGFCLATVFCLIISTVTSVLDKEEWKRVFSGPLPAVAWRIGED